MEFNCRQSEPDPVFFTKICIHRKYFSILFLMFFYTHWHVQVLYFSNLNKFFFINLFNEQLKHRNDFINKNFENNISWQHQIFHQYFHKRFIHYREKKLVVHIVNVLLHMGPMFIMMNHLHKYILFFNLIQIKYIL
jgi:hypothetical protein